MKFALGFMKNLFNDLITLLAILLIQPGTKLILLTIITDGWN